MANLRVGTAIVLLTSGLGVLGTLSGLAVAERISPEEEIDMSRVILALGIATVGVGAGIYYLTRK